MWPGGVGCEGVILTIINLPPVVMYERELFNADVVLWRQRRGVEDYRRLLQPEVQYMRGDGFNGDTSCIFLLEIGHQRWLSKHQIIIDVPDEDDDIIDDEDRLFLMFSEEMKRLEATGVYTEDEINRLAKRGKLRGHIPGVGRVLPSRATSRTSMPAPDKSLKSIHKKVDFMMSLVRSDSKYSNMFKEFELGGASGSGGCGDDEESGNDEKGEDEDEDGNGDD
ncbi:hypothetical protein Tco_1316717 [Tanacetum coccineum]